MKKLILTILVLFTTTTPFAADEIDGKVQRAIAGLAQQVKGKMEVEITIVAMGKNRDGELSDMLYNKIKSYALGSGKFSVFVSGSGDTDRAKQTKGIIKATYDSSINVTIDLMNGSKILASEQFALPAREDEEPNVTAAMPFQKPIRAIAKVSYLSAASSPEPLEQAWGGGVEVNYFLNDSYFGVGADISYNQNSRSDNLYKRYKDEISIVDLGAKVLVRTPPMIEWLEIYGAAGLSYSAIN
ncbi:MAG: hypothetical protein LBV09_03875, partial [Deferribacteraceae bacterium]|nr:hypothetical protein [Deferribacteraceae bacterium]